MHDLHLANQISNLSKDYAQKHGISHIKKVKIYLGKISEHAEVVMSENLEFNIKLLLGKYVNVEIDEMEEDGWKLERIEGE